jgi:hypothetical protein
LHEVPVVAGAVFLAIVVPLVPAYLFSKLSLSWKNILYEVSPTIITMGLITIYFWWLVLLPFLGKGEFTNSKLMYKHYKTLMPFDAVLIDTGYLLVYAFVF